MADPIDAFYQVLHQRRDVRAEFTGEPVDGAVLRRMLEAAHAAPSVGMSQPWDFILVRDRGLRSEFREHVRSCGQRFAAELEGERASTFARVKIEGILESSLSVVVTYDASRGGPAVLGRHTIADTGLYSVCLAIQNLWLAATAEGFGVGWVSFFEEAFLRELLGIPDQVRPVAWLCLGPVTQLQEKPDLERHGWRSRTPVESVLHYDRFGHPETTVPGAE
ncbi:cob(II)yrinic acid a,c-diamide reductase [Tamaricihabitans halophyticus]|uniref:Cob(II)yrinic acid a,c-diamide reductase n=1 Tax=Tamaricihabitans halophyticus TaxID=1262583 RepID=A0A4R2QGV9_9PSEU|nr:5,6-dimethylbenzimidazole synthase [Tamaricihabitans halophyticus]TCP47804.1 cob(II)yrinic acid a,c-diamide reductase [Tamaricihabitans halophyticus]